MKTFSFNLYKYTISVTIEKRKYETTVKDVFDELTEEQKYKVIERLKIAKDLVKSQSEEIKMEDMRSVEECFTEYIESQRGILSAATIKGYENVRDKHLDRIMVCYISRLDEAVIQRAFDEELAKGYSEKTIKGYKTLLMKVLAVYRPDLHPEIRIKKEAADENT